MTINRLQNRGMITIAVASFDMAASMMTVSVLAAFIDMQSSGFGPFTAKRKYDEVVQIAPKSL